jgi:signal transduction histidine kinase
MISRVYQDDRSIRFLYPASIALLFLDALIGFKGLVFPGYILLLFWGFLHTSLIKMRFFSLFLIFLSIIDTLIIIAIGGGAKASLHAIGGFCSVAAMAILAPRLRRAPARVLQPRVSQSTKAKKTAERASEERLAKAQLRQPLQAIMMNSKAALNWLDREEPDLDAARELLQRIYGNAQRASELSSVHRKPASRLFEREMPCQCLLELPDRD